MIVTPCSNDVTLKCMAKDELYGSFSAACYRFKLWQWFEKLNRMIDECILHSTVGFDTCEQQKKIHCNHYNTKYNIQLHFKNTKARAHTRSNANITMALFQNKERYLRKKCTLHFILYRLQNNVKHTHKK